MTRVLYADWIADATRRFGPDAETWRFVCPVCRYVQTMADYRAAGAPEPERVVAFSCVGRWLPKARTRESFGGAGPGPCDYAGGGLFRLNPVTVVCPDGTEYRVFAFAE